MDKVVFLDRDGTINVDYGYVHEIDKLEFVPGLLNSLKRIQDSGYKLIVITNQSGIGRKLFSREDYDSFTQEMVRRLFDNGIIIDKIYTCPHTDEDCCDCRKPLLGLYIKAIEEFNIDLPNSYAIGDRLRDLSVCNQYPVRGILYSPNNEGEKDEKKKEIYTSDRIVKLKSWLEIADYICSGRIT